MNRYTLICRLRAPGYILLTGVIALMAAWTPIGWGKSWPLYIVLEGVFQLAQRWALSQSYPPADYPPAPFSYPGVPGAGVYQGPAASQPPTTTTAIVAAPDAVPEVPGAPQSTEWRS